MTPGKVYVYPCTARASWHRPGCVASPHCRCAEEEITRLERALDEMVDDHQRAWRRVRTLEARLARVIHLVEGTSLRVYWTDHNGGGPVWHYHRMPNNPPRRGRVWSRRHARKGKENSDG